MQCLLIQIFRIGFDRFLLGFCRCPVRFQLMTAFCIAVCTASAALGKFLALMSTFHTDVFILNLVNFPMDKHCCLPHGSACRIGFNLWGSLIHLIKAQLGMRRAGCLVKNTLFV